MQSTLSAIYAKFTATSGNPAIHNDFYNNLSGKMYLAEAPQNTIMPYCTYHLITDVYDYMFSLNGQFEYVYIQFSIFSDSFSAIEVETSYDKLIALYDWCSLSITGYTQLYMKRLRSSLIRHSIDKYWMKTTDFSILAEKS